ncbi:MAG: hypothetical protein K0S64_343 [Gaiellaceae bacterium]|nr:hypothetical protein [Gaiellaceae bacterium]
MFLRIALFVLPAVLAVFLAGVAQGNPPGITDLEQTDKTWDCEPYVPIAGNYQHCAPPGKPSVTELLAGTNVPSIELRVFDFTTGEFAGIESLMRADLYQGLACHQDGQDEWGLLDLPIDYRACHRFETGNPPL